MSKACQQGAQQLSRVDVTGGFASRLALQTKKRKYEDQDEIMAGSLVADFSLVLSKQARIY
jgi:hypothetical protein